MRTYRNTMPHADFPLGGIGTGTISLTAGGHLKDFQLFNRPSLGVKIPYSFFSMYSKVNGHEDARILEAEHDSDYYEACGLHPNEVYGLPHFPASVMQVEYPFAHIDYQDDTLPLSVKLTAFSPFIPGNADDSGIPAAVFTFDVTNHSDKEAEVLICGSCSNIHNFHGFDCFKNYLVSDNCRNEHFCGKGYHGIRMTGNAVSEDDLFFSENALVACDDQAEYRTEWYRGGWYDGIQDFWNRFTKGQLKIAEEKESEKFSVVGPVSCHVGSTGIRKTILSGQTESFTFILSWYVPNRICGWTPRHNPGKTLKNHYAMIYSSAKDVAEKTVLRLEQLHRETSVFTRALYDSSLSEDMLDAIVSNIAVLRSTTCWRAADGTFYAWEGSHAQEGSCHGTCTHVWNYAQTVAFLFPELECSARINEFLVETDDEGKMSFRTQQSFGLPPFDMYPAADGQMGTIIRALREYRQSGSIDFLKKIYPGIKRAYEYARKTWDKDGDGVPEACQHNTYDIEFFGPNPLTGVMFLGMTKAMEEISRLVGDEATAREAGILCQNSLEHFEKQCWNGEYYIQATDDVNRYPYQFGSGCLSDQLLGQTIACSAGLGLLLPEDHLDKALLSIFRNNFLNGNERPPCVQRLYIARDETGLVLCTWPHGGKPDFPFVYSDEVWTGIEYQVATLLLIRGFKKEAEQMVSAIRKRFDGIRRSPWAENECGFYYTRAMASWGLLNAETGFNIKRAEGELSFSPHSDGKYLWVSGELWGILIKNKNRITIRLLHGTWKIRLLGIEKQVLQDLCLNNHPVRFEIRNGKAALDEQLCQGDELSFETNPSV